MRKPLNSKSKKKVSPGLKKNLFPYDWVNILCVILLIIFGLAFLGSTLSIKGPTAFYSEFVKQIVFGVGLGGFLAYFISRLDYNILIKYTTPLLVFTLVLLGYLGFFGFYSIFFEVARDEVVQQVSFLPIRPFSANNSLRWINFFGLQNFQPIELAKLSLLMYFAKSLQSPTENGYTWSQLKLPIYSFFTVFFLSLLQPDLGSVLIIFIILLSALWSIKTPQRILLPLLGIVIGISAIAILGTSYRLDRVLSVGNGSYQINQVQKAISSGGLWGQGYSVGELKQSGLVPEADTDAIIATIGEEMGFVRTVIFLFIYLVLVFRGLEIARQAKNPGGTVIATGISTWIGLQAFLNILGITGITPLTGIPLPFVSAGGSAMLINLVAFGVLLSVDRTTRLESSLSVKKLNNQRFLS